MPGVIDFLDDDGEGASGSVDITSSLLGGGRSSLKRSNGAIRGSHNTEGVAADEDDDDAAFINAAITKQNKRAGTEVIKKTASSKSKGKNKVASGTISGGGSFQSMGLHPSLLRSLVLRGYTTPTPIQRLAIPSIIDQPPRDLVGMARTGSGKTLAYLIPLIQRLNGRHSSVVGIKSLILCPSRELALQILRVGKEIARGWKAEEGGEAIRWGLIVGGEGMDEQFALLATNPDIIIATPGRLLHLTVEMNLDLKSVTYVVFDEADRLFEMGFADQLEELLVRLPTSRQTLLFSATLPTSLVDFARAGLQANPKLVRLDADSKISEDLRMAFFSVKPQEKEASLLLLLRDVIGVPVGEASKKISSVEESYNKKRKRGHVSGLSGADELLPHQTIIFCATKHHVEYLLLLLTTAGYTCSHIYSSLDQAARGLEMKKFREGQTSLLIVTDVAARGIDLPVLEHVVNYDFPSSPRVFVHRVGRTARAGKRGFAWNLVQHSELPYLCDLQLFLARPLLPSSKLVKDDEISEQGALDLHDKLVIGTFPRASLDDEIEYINESLSNASSSVAVALPALKQVVARATKMYQRSQVKASQESYRRAKEMTKGGDGVQWALAGSSSEEDGVHDVVKRPLAYGLFPVKVEGEESEEKSITVSGKKKKESASEVAARAALLSKVNSFRPSETVFEVGARGATPNALLMKDRRRVLAGKAKRGEQIEASKAERRPATEAVVAEDEEHFTSANMAAEEDIQDVFDITGPSRKKSKSSFRDPEFYMDYEQKDAHTEKGYSLNNSDSFTQQANRAAFSLANDEATLGTKSQAPNTSRWDVKKKKFVQGDGTGADNKKLIKTESGRKLPASFKSGRYDEWQKEQRMSTQRVGEKEDSNVVRTARGLFEKSRGGRGGGSAGRGGGGRGGRTYMHTQTKPGKRPDRFQDNYEKNLARYKEKNDEGSSSSRGGPAGRGRGRGGASAGARGGRGGAARGGRQTGAKARSELKDARQIQKDRALANKRKEKNARPSRKGKGRR